VTSATAKTQPQPRATSNILTSVNINLEPEATSNTCNNTENRSNNQQYQLEINSQPLLRATSNSPVAAATSGTPINSVIGGVALICSGLSKRLWHITTTPVAGCWLLMLLLLLLVLLLVLLGLITHGDNGAQQSVARLMPRPLLAVLSSVSHLMCSHKFWGKSKTRFMACRRQCCCCCCRCCCCCWCILTLSEG